MTTNKNDANKQTVLAALANVRAALEQDSGNADAARALGQCDRLQLAIEQFHAEGLRFAAFTLLRMVQSSGTTFSEPVQISTRQLKAALDAAGYPH